jgi:DNA-binding LacI/PurR family transcriptional regulator
VPVVYAGRTPSIGDSDESWVDSDSLHGAMAAVEHLLGRGRRHVVTIAGPQEMAAGLDRRAGWRHALRAAAIDPPAEWVEVGTFLEESGYECMTRLLSRVPDLDAVFVASDLMAMGAIRALRDAGKQVPDDVSQQVENMGRILAETLLSRLQGEDKPQQIVLPTALVVRASS